MRKIWLTLMLSCTALTVVTLGMAGCRSQQPAKKDAGLSSRTDKAAVEKTVFPVAVAPLALTSIEERVDVTGTLKAATQITVSPRVGGRIDWIVGKEGTAVKRGEVVARLDDTDIRTQVRAAKAGLEAAHARLEQAKAAAEQQLVSTDSGIRNAQAELLSAQARLKQAQATASATEATSEAQVKTAQATLDAAQSHLDLVKNGARTEERAVAENNAELAQATYENDRANFERYKNLYDQKAIARSLLDNAETKMKVSAAQYKSAKEQLAMIKIGARQEDIASAEANVRQAEEGLISARANLKQVEVAKANVEIARAGMAQARAMLASAKAARQVNIMRDKDVLAAQSTVTQAREALTSALQAQDYTLVYSPVDGVVSTRIADVGESIGSNDPVLSIASEQSLYFEAGISELEATRLRAGQSVVLSVDALQGSRANMFADAKTRTITGMVEKVVPVVNDRTRTFLVRILVPRDGQLFPGMFARGAVVVARHAGILAVPKDALVKRGEQEVVFVIEGDTARERPVTLGASTEELVQVLSGLNAGDQIVTIGQRTLLNGDRVRVNSTK